jgi:hypothetical protein
MPKEKYYECTDGTIQKTGFEIVGNSNPDFYVRFLKHSNWVLLLQMYLLMEDLVVM